MWLYPIAIVLILLGIVGGILTGGIFTIVLLPLGIIVLIAALATGSLAGARERHRQAEEAPEPPLPHASGTGAGPTGPAVSSPAELVDARRAEQ